MKKWILIIIGTIAWSLTMVKSGIPGAYGLGFWGANGHDGIWHIALARSLAKGSFDNPVFAGELLKNYHLGFDLFLSFLSRTTGVPPVNLYFQILPPIFAFVIGLLVYWFIENWQHSKRAAWWSVFFVYFGGSFGWIIGKGESAFWSAQAISTLINPPFALSLILILSGLIFLLKYQKSFSIWHLAFSIFCFGILVQVKVYAGLLVLFALGVAALFRLIKIRDRQHLSAGRFLILFAGVLTLSILVYFPFNKFSSGLVVWQPFWFLETMMHLTDRVGWVKFGEAMVNYKAAGAWVKTVLAYGAAFAIFVIGNFGTRILSISYALKAVRSKISEIDIFVFSVIAAGVAVPMLFLQKGTPWNTIQFLYYSLFFSGLLAGVVIGKFLEKPVFSVSIMNKHSALMIRIIGTSIILLTIPTAVFTLKDVYIPARPPAVLPTDEASALKFLSGQPDGVVLTYPFDPVKAREAEGNPPRPLYLYESTAYVAAFSGHPIFLEDQVNLDITGYDWKARRAVVENWYKKTDQKEAREFLKDNNIKYVYWVKPQRAVLGEGNLGLKGVFENQSVIIYRVN